MLSFLILSCVENLEASLGVYYLLFTLCHAKWNPPSLKLPIGFIAIVSFSCLFPLCLSPHLPNFLHDEPIFSLAVLAVSVFSRSSQIVTNFFCLVPFFLSVCLCDCWLVHSWTQGSFAAFGCALSLYICYFCQRRNCWLIKGQCSPRPFSLSTLFSPTCTCCFFPS